jgi:outer membrane receptor protein involved in Fe transport
MPGRTYRSARKVLVWLLLVLPAAVAAAQQEPAENKDAQEEEGELIEVTGTRLRVVLPEGARPLTVLDRDQLEDSGEELVGEFLQKSPFMSGSPLGTTSGRRGEGGGLSRGIATVELRGLGPQRTLVLVNGRRFVPGGNGASGVVDLNMIPMAIVDRIEIFKSGASVEYGADAIAGVINIITRKTTDGLEIVPRVEATAHGDGEAYDVSLAYGERRDRLQLMTALEYTDQAAVSKGDRDFSAVRKTLTGPDNEITFDGSSAPPSGNFRTSMGRLTLIEGEDGDSPDDFRPWIGDNTAPDTDRFNFNPFEDLQQPSERLSLFAQGRYEVAPQLSFFAEAFYHERDSRTRLAPLPFFTTREEGVVISADNVFNPFGETIEDARRRLVEAGPREFEQDNQAWRAVVGADGLVNGWIWDAQITHGRNETTQYKTGELLDSRLQRALGPSFVGEGGEPVCGTPDAPIPDCVPLNLFGGPGSITPGMLDYVSADLRDEGFNEQTVASANLSGTPLALPVGDVAVAFGYEYREEEAADRPDPQTVAGNTTGSARGVTAGSFDSHEAYVEFGVPLARAESPTGEMSLDLGARLVEFSNFGTETVFEAGLYWRPLEPLQLRAAYAEAFRAPNIRELFGGLTQSNPIVEDPCADFAELSAVEIERCIEQGVPADGSFTQTGEEIPELSGGNPNLQAEQADVVTAGLTWTPASLSPLELRVDYYDIAIDGGIAGLGANTILEQCLATGAAAFCDRIDRTADGRIVDVSAQLQNLASETAQGIDVEARYRHAGWSGALSHRLMVGYVEERELIAFPGAEPLAGAGGYDQDSFGAIPRWQGRYALTWRSGRWRAGYDAQWIGPIDERGGEVFPGTVNEVSGTLYHDFFGSYEATEKARLSFGIDNLLDDEPPFFANADEANTDVSTYRVLGTTFWVRFEYHAF